MFSSQKKTSLFQGTMQFSSASSVLPCLLREIRVLVQRGDFYPYELFHWVQRIKIRTFYFRHTF